MRQYDVEIAALAAELAQFDAASQENLLLEKSLGLEAERLQEELGSPEVARDPKIFKRVNDSITSALSNKASAQRAIQAFGKARGEIAVKHQLALDQKNQAKGIEWGISAIEVGKELDEQMVQLKTTVQQLLAYTNATSAAMAAGGAKSTVWDPKVTLSQSIAQILRDAGLDIQVGDWIRSSVGATGYHAISDAMAEFQSAVDSQRPR